MPLKSDKHSLVLAAAKTLDAIPYRDEDAALRTLVTLYAEQLDATNDFAGLGSRLLSALEALQATPRARRGQTPSDDAPDVLAQFWADRAGA